MFFPDRVLYRPVEDIFLPGDKELFGPVVLRAREGAPRTQNPDWMSIDQDHLLVELKQMLERL